MTPPAQELCKALRCILCRRDSPFLYAHLVRVASFTMFFAERFD